MLISIFALQHLGKNYFDMGKWPEAIKCFEEAIELRKEKGDRSLLESSEYAAIVTKNKLVKVNGPLHLSKGEVATSKGNPKLY